MIAFFRALGGKASALLLAIYMFTLGLWISLPFKSFGPAFTNGRGQHLYGGIGEFEYGFIYMIIGAAIAVAIYYASKKLVKWLLLLAASWWIFVIVGYALTLWNGTTTISSLAALTWATLTYLMYQEK